MWYNSSWLYRVKITVDHTKVPTNDQTDFPVFVNLATLPAGFFSHVKSDGGDIRVTTSDGVTEVPREVVSISTGGSTGEIHLKAPTLSHTTDTAFYIYYGNSGVSEPAASATYGSQNVWTNGFLAVYHFEANGNDSTSNAHNMVGHNTPTFAAGKVGKGVSLASSQYLTIPTSSWLVVDAFTIGLWAKTSAVGGSGSHIFIYDTGGVGAGITLRANSSTEAETRLMSGASVITDIDVTGLSPLDDGNFKYWLTKRIKSGGNPNHYLEINNSVIGSAFNNSTTQDANGNHDVYVGMYIDGSSFGWVGMFDELRFANTYRADDWITTEYNNQGSPSTFYSVAAQESQGVSPSASVSPSSSVSASKSPSASVSPSSSVSSSSSSSKSPSSSQSPSASNSPSSSTSLSVSPSSSQSPSASVSPSSSVSSSPSQGYEDFTREESLILPSDDADLFTPYSDAEKLAVSKSDGDIVIQVGGQQYMIHQFKVFIGDAAYCEVQYEGYSTLAPSLSAVYLQIFNQLTGLWETLTSNHEASANINFELESRIADTTNYKNNDKTISCRVYQLAI